MKKRYYGIDKEKLEAKLKQLEKLSLQEGPIGIEFEIQMLAVQNVLDCLEPDEPEKTARQIASKQLHNPTEWDEPTEPPTDSHSCSGCDECKQPVNGTYTEPPRCIHTAKGLEAYGACEHDSEECACMCHQQHEPALRCTNCLNNHTPKETRLSDIRFKYQGKGIPNGDAKDNQLAEAYIAVNYLLEQLDTAKEALEEIAAWELMDGSEYMREMRDTARKALDYLDE